MAVMDDFVHIVAGQLISFVAKSLGACFVDERQFAFEIDAINAVAHRFQDQLALASGQVERFFGFMLFGNVNAMAQNERALAAEFHPSAAERNASIDAVTAP